MMVTNISLSSSCVAACAASYAAFRIVAISVSSSSRMTRDTGKSAVAEGNSPICTCRPRARRLRTEFAAVAQLAAHRWPGNFRELRAVLTRALLLERRDTFERLMQLATLTVSGSRTYG